MSKQDDGGPAFPVVGSDQCKDYPGMSLRDYFAAKAMQTLLIETVREYHTGEVGTSGPCEEDSLEREIEVARYTNDDFYKSPAGHFPIDELAEKAYLAANAMLRARGSVVTP